MYYYSKVNKKFQKYAFLQLRVLLLQQKQQQVLLLLLLPSKGISPHLPVNALDPQNSDGIVETLYISVSQPLGLGPVPGPGINYTGPREA